MEEVLAQLDEVEGGPAASEGLLEIRLEALFRCLAETHKSRLLVLVDDAQWVSAPILRSLSHARIQTSLSTVTAGREVRGAGRFSNDRSGASS